MKQIINDFIKFAKEEYDIELVVADRLKAHWIEIPGVPPHNRKKCSSCGTIVCCQGNYCMNCGAKMEG